MALNCQTAYKEALSRGKTPEMTALARKADKDSHAELNRMRALPCNAECFDCTALKPGWAVLPHGVFVCIECAQVHRNIGRHISQTKAINTGTYLWYPHELQVMREIGNGRALRALRGAPSKPSRDAPAAEKESYVRAKYEERRWGPFYDDSPAPAAVAPTKKPAPAAVAPPTKPASAAVATPAEIPSAPTKPKHSVGLAQAKRQPAPAVADLISFDVCSEPQKKAPSTWAVWEPTEVPEKPSKQDEGDWTVWEPTGALPTGAPLATGWDTKKAAILSQFEAVPAMPMDSSALFFARFGL